VVVACSCLHVCYPVLAKLALCRMDIHIYIYIYIYIYNYDSVKPETRPAEARGQSSSKKIWTCAPGRGPGGHRPGSAPVSIGCLGRTPPGSTADAGMECIAHCIHLDSMAPFRY
jgi:hypothetical protein